ncbi:MAG: heavy-metal-associated domain-containing protein [Acidimicrobiia bacterium]
MTRLVSVPGISCNHCKQAIEHELRTTDGITHAEVSIANKTVVVDGDTSDAAIIAAIDAAGYDVASIALDDAS